MLKKIILSIAIGLLFFTTNTATAQTKQGRFNFHIGPTIPIDDFGDDEIGGAGIGLGLGIEYIYPLTETGVGLFFGADINYNATTSDYEEYFIDVVGRITRHYIDKNDVTFFKYINIPVSTGLNYTFKADDKLSVYTNLGLAVNLLKITDFTVEEVSETFDLANSFGVKIGGGIILNNNIYISLNYFGLGKHKIKSEVKSFRIKAKREISMLTLTIGFRL